MRETMNILWLLVSIHRRYYGKNALWHLREWIDLVRHWGLRACLRDNLCMSDYATAYKVWRATR